MLPLSCQLTVLAVYSGSKWASILPCELLCYQVSKCTPETLQVLSCITAEYTGYRVLLLSCQVSVMAIAANITFSKPFQVQPCVEDLTALRYSYSSTEGMIRPTSTHRCTLNKYCQGVYRSVIHPCSVNR